MRFRFIKTRGRALLWICLALCLGLPLAVWLVNHWMVQRIATRVFAEVAAVPARDVALVLGTSAHTAGGYDNPHFQNAGYQ